MNRRSFLLGIVATSTLTAAQVRIAIGYTSVRNIVQAVPGKLPVGSVMAAEEMEKVKGDLETLRARIA